MLGSTKVQVYIVVPHAQCCSTDDKWCVPVHLVPAQVWLSSGKDVSWRAVEEALTSLEMKEAAQKIKEKYLEDKGGGVVSAWVWEEMSTCGKGAVMEWNVMSRMNRIYQRAKVQLCFLLFSIIKVLSEVLLHSSITCRCRS